MEDREWKKGGLGMPSSILHPQSSLPSPRGFTLIELLVTIGIIALLVALALPAILKMKTRGIETRIRSDLALIATALEDYKNYNASQYPNFDDSNGTDAQSQNSNLYSVDALNIQQDRGARLLCRALLGPAASRTQADIIANYTFGFGDSTKTNERAWDGADGPGYRVRVQPNGLAYGKVYGPYIDGSKFKLGNSGTSSWDSLYFKDATLLDVNGNSILYYPANTSALITKSAGNNNPVAFVTRWDPPGLNPTQPPPPRPYYNAFDNFAYGEQNPPVAPATYLLDKKQMQYILGDRQGLGYLTAGETAATTAPYLLWCAGADGHYGFGVNSTTNQPYDPTMTPSLKTDDITNFDIPPDLHK